MASKTFASARKIVAICGLAAGFAGFGQCVGVGTSAADPTPDTGTYDELVEVHDGGILDIADDDGIQADAVTNSVAHEPNAVTGH